MNEKKFPLYTALILFALAIVVIILRLHSLGEPLDRDLTSYGYFAHQMLGGEELYSYLLDHHPPGTYVLFMLTELVFGYNATGIIYMGTVFSLITMLFIYLFIKEIANKNTALIGALFWALASNSIALEANLPNTELFMSAFTMIALYGLVRFGPDNRRGLAFTGFFFAIASVFKMVVFFPFLAVAVYVIIDELGKGGKSRVAGGVRKLSNLCIPGFIVWTLIFFYFIVQGRLTDFWKAVFVFNRDYTESVTRNLFYYFTTAKEFFHTSQIEIVILALFSLFFLIIATTRRSKYGPLRWPFFLLLLFGTMVEVASPGYFFPHYYQLFVPIFSIMGALFLFELYCLVKERRAKIALTAVIIAGLIPVISLGYWQAQFLRMSPNEISEKKYMTMFIESFDMAAYIKEKTAPCETIYVYGQDTGIYYYSQRKAATGIIFVTILFFGTKDEQFKRQKKFYDNITTKPPAYFIWNLAWGDVRENIFYDFLNENYTLVGRKFDYYLVFEYNHRERNALGIPHCPELDRG